jgi:hypothetical protein
MPTVSTGFQAVINATANQTNYPFGVNQGFFVGLLLLISGIPSDAARRVARGSSYDGTWSVAIYTLRGDCGSLRAALRIIGGRVSSGDGSYQAYGAVGAGGAIRVTLIRGSQSASGSGRLSSNSGGGRWRTSGGECFGSWSAARQAAY